MYELLVLSAAEKDIDLSFAFYQSKRPKLGAKFITTLEQKFSQIKNSPESFPDYGVIFKKAVITKFPHSIYYKIEKDAVIIIGIIHQARGAEYLYSRLK